MDKKTIGILVGSLRKESFTKKIAGLIGGMIPSRFDVRLIDISNLEMYNQDFDDENRAPQSWQDFRNQIKQLDGVLFATPEYNRSTPAVLKNALDVASRPYGKNCWDGKPGAIISVSPGKIGAFGANHHLRQSMAFLNVYMLQQPEAYIGEANLLFDDTGNVTNNSTKEFLQSFTDAFIEWVERFF